MTSTRSRRAVAIGMCLVAVLAAVLPGVATLEFLVLPLAWDAAPDESTRAVAAPAIDAAVQPLSLRSLQPSRAPPSPGVA